MELTKDISAEYVHFQADKEILSEMVDEVKAGLSTSQTENLLDFQVVFGRVVDILLKKIENDYKPAYFQLGLLYFEEEMYTEAREYFMKSKGFDYQSVYQLSVMLYDGLGGDADMEEGVRLMKKLVCATSKNAKHLLSAVRFNIGRAYFQGFGVERQSDAEAERWWLMAADDGNPKASVKAQSVLGMFYSRVTDDSLDLSKAFFWHTEACGNGSLESQGALGVMYLNGVGVPKDIDAAYVCLKDSSDRGNVYAMGNLIALLYMRKMFTKAAELAGKLAMFDDVDMIAKETDCMHVYIKKGISLACFYFARCLQLGRGTNQDVELARTFYSKSFQFDPDICARLQNIAQHGHI